MRAWGKLSAGLFVSLLASQPALAQSGLVSEPSDLSLLVLGIVGLLLGRQGARKRPQ